MTLQIEKTYPGGVKRLGYASDTSFEVTPFTGMISTTALTTIVSIIAKIFAAW
jgi:hypothetical protein